MKPALRLLPALLMSLTIACATTPDPKPAAQPEAAPVAETAKPAVVDYNGEYTNGDGGTLTITDFDADEGFLFRLTIEGGEACDGVDYESSAKFGAPGKASNPDEDSFVFDKGKIKFEPSTSMIGMDCARVIHVEFAK